MVGRGPPALPWYNVLGGGVAHVHLSYILAVALCVGSLDPCVAGIN